jgi:hypothetical protein
MAFRGGGGGGAGQINREDFVRLIDADDILARAREEYAAANARAASPTAR